MDFAFEWSSGRIVDIWSDKLKLPIWNTKFFIKDPKDHQKIIANKWIQQSRRVQDTHTKTSCISGH